jgi:hypothetical protein
MVSRAKTVRSVRVAPQSRCQVTIPECPKDGNVAGIFNDSWEGADKNEKRCLARADEWLAWCGTSKSVTARFFGSGKLVGERNASK